MNARDLIALLATLDPDTEIRTYSNEGGSRTQSVGRVVPLDYQGRPNAVALDEALDAEFED